MQLIQEVTRLSDELIQPLCDATKKLFRRCRIASSDRIVIAMSKDLKSFKLKFFAIRDGRRTYASYDARFRFPTRICEVKRAGDDAVVAGATDLTAIIVAYHWAPEQIVFDDQLAQQQFKYFLANFVSQTRNIAARDDIEKLHFQDSELYPLNRYQQVALKGSLNREGYGLFMQQGTGKTAIVIARICNEARLLKIRESRPYRALVICPKNVRENWVSEFHKFATEAGKITVVRGDKLGRMSCLIDAMRQSSFREDDKYTVVVASYDSIATTLDGMLMPEWDLCVLDESHYIKNPETRRWKSMVKLRDRCAKRMCLTGTPITNTMLDLYTQFEFLGEGWSGFSSWPAFKKFFGQFKAVQVGKEGEQQNQYERLIGCQNVPMLQERLVRQAYLIRKREALPDLPKKMYNVHEVEMTPEQSKVYDDVSEQLIAEIENELAATGETSKQYLVVQNTLTKMLRLAQITSGFVGVSEVVDDLGNTISPAWLNRFDPNPKIEELVGILKKRNKEEKTIIWACFTQDIKSIAARMRLEGIDAVTYHGATGEYDRTEAVRRFNCDPECTVFIGNAAAGGTGINLLGYDHAKIYNGMPPTYCNSVIYYSQNWSPTARSQSEDRAHRKGTVTHVQYTDLVVPGTIDLDIRKRVVEKRTNALKIQDVRELLKNAKGLKS